MDSFDAHPTVLWELTRACDLHCRGCPTNADPRRASNELSTYEAYKTIDQIAALNPRELVVTGGDPLERPDVYQIVDYARRRGLEPALVLNATSNLTIEAVARLQRYGLTRVILSVDSAATPMHRALHWVKTAGLEMEVNTLVCRANAGDLAAIAELLRPLGIKRWNLHFLVPVGGSRTIEALTAAETEALFATIDDLRATEPFAVRVVEAPHYRRHRLQRNLRARLDATDEWSDFASYESDPSDTVREGARGFVYISHAGDVRPSEFVPQSAGNLRYRSLGTIYRGSDLFVALRDVENLKGRCHRCDFRHVCGGSRARAWAVTGDLFGSDPLCAYDPPQASV